MKSFNNFIHVNMAFKSRYMLSAFVIISILVGLFVFSSVKYKNLTLKIYAKTFQKGFKTILIKESGGEASTLVYETKDNEGYNCLYPIVLHPVSIESLKIAPLGANGEFEITGIELSNDTKSYIWDAQLNCIERYRAESGAINKPCNSNAPKLIPNADLSVDILGIVSVKSENSFVFRILIAMISMIVVLSPVVLLTRWSNNTHYAGQLAWLLFLLMYIRQLYFIGAYSVDLPAWEEWEFFESTALPKGLTLNWLFCFSGEHIIFFHKLMAWINQQLFDLDFNVQRIINYLVFGCVLLAISHLKSKIIGRDAFQLFPLFLIFLVSCLNHESHMNTAALSYHFVFLFSFFALYSAFEYGLKTHIALFVTWTCLAIISHSTGVIIALMYLLCFAVYITADIISNKIDFRKLWLLLIMYLPIGLTMAYWYYGYQLPNAFAHPPRTSPLDYLFWECFFNLVSFGFGVETEQIIIGVICFVIAVSPVVLLLYQRETRWQSETRRLIAAIVTIIVILLTISMGRAWQQGAAKTSRFAEMASMLIPFTAMAWWIVLKNKEVLRYAILISLWVICFVGYYDNWSEKPYRRDKQGYIYNLECLNLINSGSSELCPDDHPIPIQSAFEQAKKMDIKFTRQFRH